MILDNNLGLRSGDRSSNSAFSTYLNGVETALSPFSSASTFLPTEDLYGLARHHDINAANISDAQLSLFAIGGSLGEAKTLILYNAFQALMTYYGTQV